MGLYLNNRDYRTLHLIEDFGCGLTRQIHDICFNDVTIRRCQQRLNKLSEHKHLFRSRDYISQDYIYYISDRKPKEIKHMITRLDFYVRLIKDYKLCEFIPEYSIEGGDLRSDAYFEVWRNGYILPYFLEVQITTNFNQKKYEDFYNSGAWIEKWEQFPTVVTVSDHKLHYKQSAIKYMRFGLQERIILY